MYTRFFKRFLDFFVALILLLLLFPLIALVALLLLIANNGTPFFVQTRPGKNEKLFNIFKFKTMNDKVDDKGELLPDGQRLTFIGKIIRKTSIDELPQLVNVLKGDMSFIGPRPLLVRYLPYYTEKEKARHTVRPGITGLAQISGRNFLDWDERLEKDVYYVENLSFALDFQVFIKTIKKVIMSKDVATNPNAVIKDLDASRSKN